MRGTSRKTGVWSRQDALRGLDQPGSKESGVGRADWIVGRAGGTENGPCADKGEGRGSQ